MASILRKIARYASDREYRSLTRHAHQDFNTWRSLYLCKAYFLQGFPLWILRFPLERITDYRITYWVMSLETQERTKIVELNRSIIPTLRIWKSVNGYVPEQTE